MTSQVGVSSRCGCELPIWHCSLQRADCSTCVYKVGCIVIKNAVLHGLPCEASNSDTSTSPLVLSENIKFQPISVTIFILYCVQIHKQSHFKCHLEGQRA